MDYSENYVDGLVRDNGFLVLRVCKNRRNIFRLKNDIWLSRANQIKYITGMP